MNVYNVTVVGPSGSGKTVYLASLFRHLAVQRDGAGFFVQTDFPSAKLLNNTYGEIVRPGEWPEATILSQVRELTFTCGVRSPHGVFNPLAIRYVDYGGEIITDVPEQGAASAAKLEGRLVDSHVLLVFLDGMKVLNHLDGDSRLIDELVPVFNRMQSSDAVVHCVITKWDLLHPRFTLQDVAKCLLDEPAFAGFVGLRGASNGRSGVVRLFPVSSVGPGFVDPDPGGGMAKRPGAKPHPLNVEIPFAAILPDLLEQTFKSIVDPSPNLELVRRDRLLNRLRQASAILPTATKLLRTTTTKASPRVVAFGEGVAETFTDWAQSRLLVYENRLEEAKNKHRAEAAKIADERTALKHLIESFELLLADFEEANPGSRLSTGSASA